jgi:uncharacterized protein DUF559
MPSIPGCAGRASGVTNGNPSALDPHAGGIATPHVQFDLTDEQGRFVGRADLYYSSARLVVEYDGLNHRDRLIQDNRRQNVILGAGYQLLRFTAADIRERRDAMVSQVRTALSAGVAVSARRPAAVRR